MGQTVIWWAEMQNTNSLAFNSSCIKGSHVLVQRYYLTCSVLLNTAYLLRVIKLSPRAWLTLIKRRTFYFQAIFHKTLHFTQIVAISEMKNLIFNLSRNINTSVTYTGCYNKTWNGFRSRKPTWASVVVPGMPSSVPNVLLQAFNH